MLSKKILYSVLLGSIITLSSSMVFAKEQASSQAVSMEDFKKLQQELIFIKDNQEIRNLVNNLQNPVDASDAAKFRANFMPEGIFELIEDRNGKPYTLAEVNMEKVENFLNTRFEIFKKQDEQRRHLLTNIYISEQSATQAKVKITALLLTTVKHKTIKFVTPLEYAVLVTKDKNGNWKFMRVTGYLDTSLDAVAK